MASLSRLNLAHHSFSISKPLCASVFCCSNSFLPSESSLIVSIFSQPACIVHISLSSSRTSGLSTAHLTGDDKVHRRGLRIVGYIDWVQDYPRF
ncbi:hypothetical protein AAFC00_006283 [Neodothiora populina]|uniref:Uncharacterized protein n=1 Tax=Neodothiora populina TaxID=2781224 RepID=A0ABR3P615_9PEZI